MISDHYKKIREISAGITQIENALPGFEELFSEKVASPAIIIGITGAPGSGKSTLTDALISEMVNDDKKVAVLCVDPSSPFNRGALLGDRIRMSEWYTHPDVYIRSLASRSSLGGLHPRIVEIAEFVRNRDFDYVIIETVGVGQSEVDIAALADCTIVVLTPEGGDSIQNMKSGLMEIADLFVINKSDRPGADMFYNNLKKMLGPGFKKNDGAPPVFKTIAASRSGVKELYDYLKKTSDTQVMSEERKMLLLQKAIQMLQSRMMEEIDVEQFKKRLDKQLEGGQVNLFRFVNRYFNEIKGREI